MKAHCEWHSNKVGSIRIGKNDWEWGDPYSYYLTIEMSSPPEIRGLTEKPTRAMWRAVRALLARENIPFAIFKRADGRELIIRREEDV
jgi:hypothetical protein